MENEKSCGRFIGVVFSFSALFLRNEQERVQREFEEANAAYQEQKLKVDILEAELELLDSAIEAMKGR